MKIRDLLVGFILAMMVLCAGSFKTNTVKAYPYRLVDTWYYTDELHTTQCGFRHENCKGQVTIYGTVTPYDYTVIEECWM
jgi:hypothetical protein